MRPPHWQQNHQSARLVQPRFAATVDVARPDLGLSHLEIDGDRLESCGILQVSGPSLGVESAPTVADWYVRGGDLVATYKPSAAEQLSPQIYWRVLASSHEAVIAVVELVVSVQTDLLQSHPALSVTAQLPRCEAARLVDADSARFEPLALGSGEPLVIEPTESPGALLLRLPGDRVSFALLIHPTDFQSATLSMNAEGPCPLRLSHPLLGEDLEKGVIRRARCQAIFVERTDDAALVAECYSRFALTAPPLAT